MKQRIWDNLLDAGRMSRYYGARSDRAQTFHLVLTIATIMSTIAAATVLLWENIAVSAGFFFLSALLSIVSVVLDFSGRAQVSRMIAGQLREIEVQLRLLWHNDSPDVQIVELLEGRVESAVREDPFLSVNETLNNKCNEEAYRAIESYYGPEPRARLEERTPAAAS